jgi:hypothetical protein
MTNKQKIVQLLFISFVILLLLPTQLFATDEGGGEPWAFLTIGAGARAMGLGGAYVAVVEDSTATYWNPAGLGFLNKRLEMTFMHIGANEVSYAAEGIAGRHEYGSLAFALPGDLGNMGAFVNYFNIGDIQYTTGTSELSFQRISDTNQQDTEIACTLSYGSSIQRWFALGLSLRFMRQQIFEMATNGFGSDLGFIMKGDRWWRLRVGYVFQINFRRRWSKSSAWEDEFGSFYQLSDEEVDNTEKGFSSSRFGWAFDPIFNKNVTWTMAFALLNQNNKSPLTLSIGTECLFGKILAIRLGVNEWRIHRRDSSDATWEIVKYRGRLTGGFGIIISPLHLQLDYAVSKEPLALKHRISSTFSW